MNGRSKIRFFHTWALKPKPLATGDYHIILVISFVLQSLVQLGNEHIVNTDTHTHTHFMHAFIFTENMEATCVMPYPFLLSDMQSLRELLLIFPPSVDKSYF